MDQARSTDRILGITVGLPGAGKSTLAARLGFDVKISLDDLRERLWGDASIQDGPGGVELLVEFQKKALIQAISEGKSIIVHNTSIKKTHRKELADIAKKAGYKVWIYYFDIPPEVCKKRNAQRRKPVPCEVIDAFAREMEVPEQDEADRIITIRQDICQSRDLKPCASRNESAKSTKIYSQEHDHEFPVRNHICRLAHTPGSCGRKK